ncbi:MAG: response regulator transcription factor [Flavobacteriales bacterium]|nr:response regulator transcription factor [Flavobacteriales bacterium]
MSLADNRALIAEKCGITYATGNTHVSHIYQKLQVQGVTGAVSLAVREGLV